MEHKLVRAAGKRSVFHDINPADRVALLWSDRCRWRVETSRIGVKLPRSSERLEQAFSASGVLNLAVQVSDSRSIN